MKKFKNISNDKNLVIPASLITAIILSFFVISPVIADVKKGMDTHANCVKTVLPENIEREITIDPETGTILVEYEENGVKKETVLNLKKDLKINDCSSGTKELIAVAQNITDKMKADTCKELKEISSGAQSIPSMDGKKMDMKAADNYIRNHCQ